MFFALITRLQVDGDSTAAVVAATVATVAAAAIAVAVVVCYT